MWKTTEAKPQWVILRSQLPKFHYYHNKRLQVKESQYLIPIYSWTPNTQLDLFCSDNFFFRCTVPNTWLTNCADLSTRLQSSTIEGCWLQSSSVHPNDEDQEDAWSQNSIVHKQSNFFKNDELGQILSPVTICLTKLCLTLVQLVNFLTALKIVLLYA